MVDESLKQIIIDDLKYLRTRLDNHIDDETDKLNQIRRDVTCVKLQLEGHKGKIATFTASIAVIISAIATYITSLLLGNK